MRSSYNTPFSLVDTDVLEEIVTFLVYPEDGDKRAVIILHGVTRQRTIIVVLTVFKFSDITKWSAVRRGHFFAFVKPRGDASSQRHAVQLSNN